MRLPLSWLFTCCVFTSFALRAATVVNLDFTADAPGPLTSKNNAGTIGGSFVQDGPDALAVTPVAGVNALTLDGSGDWLVGPDSPVALTGAGVRTIEVWAHNPATQAEESLISWGRLGTGLANAAYNYGNSTSFGAVSHGSADAAWFSSNYNPRSITPEANQWHHLVYSYDGSVVRLYVDGVLLNYQNQGVLATAATATGGSPLKFVLGNQNQADGTRLNDASRLFSGSIAKVRVHDTVLTADAIAAQFNTEAAAFGKTAAASPAAPAILSFSRSTRNFTAGNAVTLTWSVDGATSVTLNGTSVAAKSTTSVSPTAKTTYTIAATKSGTTVTRNVILVPNGATPLALAHRWSFNEPVGSTSFADSVGGLAATLVGTGSCDGSKVVLPDGGSSATAAYVDLPNGFFSRLQGDVTFEGWTTITGNFPWSRFFDFGNSLGGEYTGPGGTGVGNDYVFTSAYNATVRTHTIGIKRNGPETNLGCGTNPSFGTQFHFVLVYDLDGNNGSPQIRAYRNGVLVGTLNTSLYLADIVDVNNFLGRSNSTTDNNLKGNFNEFRVWDGALSATDITDNFTAGPDTLVVKPRVNSFTATPAGFSLGQPITLNWDTTGTTTTIDNGIGAVAPTGSLVVSPSAGTTYTITTTTGAFSATATATVTRLDSPLTLAHRWSFNEAAGATTFADSISNDPVKAAVLKGAGGSSNGTSVVLPGGASTQGYVDLPNGILSSRPKDVTIEGWATVSGAQTWSRIFDIGTTTVGEVTTPGGGFNGTRYLYLNAQTNTDTTRHRVAFTNLASNTVTENTINVPTPGPGAEFHFVLVYQGLAPKARLTSATTATASS